MRDELLAELSETYKHFEERHNSSVEVDFMLEYYSFFAQSKSVLYDTLKGQHDVDGNTLCNLLGIADYARVDKVKEIDIHNFCYRSAGSVILKKALSAFKELGSATLFYVAGKRKAVIVTNQFEVRPQNTFIHWLPSTGPLNDLYWATAKDAYGEFQLWH